MYTNKNKIKVIAIYPGNKEKICIEYFDSNMTSTEITDTLKKIYKDCEVFS